MLHCENMKMIFFSFDDVASIMPLNFYTNTLSVEPYKFNNI